MAFKTDYARVEGLGSAGDGVHHWWVQRLSALALIPLTPLFIIPFGRAIGGGPEALAGTYGHFGNALAAVLFLAVTAWHLSLGIQTVIEDYVPSKGLRLALLILSKLLCGALAAAGILAVATILFRA